jgi:rubrerythrin
VSHASFLFEEKLPDRFPRLTSLYEKSKKDFWNETTAVDWDQPLTLSPDERKALAHVLSIIYYGERAAMTIAAQLVVTAKDEEARQLFAAQTIEEAKHVGAFQRLLARLDRIHPPSFFARRLLTDLIDTEEPAAKLTGMHLFVENIANHTFQAVRASVQDPLVQKVLEYVARDEKKHTAIAVLYLPTLLKELPLWKIAWLEAKQVKWLALGLGMVRDGYEDARLLHIDLAAAGQKAFREHHRLRAQMETTRGLLDVPGFDKVIDLIGRWATPPRAPPREEP